MVSFLFLRLILNLEVGGRMTLGGPRIPDSEPFEFELTSVRAGEDPAVELKMAASDKRSFALSLVLSVVYEEKRSADFGIDEC